MFWSVRSQREMWEMETVSKTRDDSRDWKKINILTIFGKEKENCSCRKYFKSANFIFKLHAFYRNVPRLTQMLSWRTLSLQQRKEQPCMTVCCFTETAKIKDSVPHHARLQTPISVTTVCEIHLFQAIF